MDCHPRTVRRSAVDSGTVACNQAHGRFTAIVARQLVSCGKSCARASPASYEAHAQARVAMNVTSWGMPAPSSPNRKPDPNPDSKPSASPRRSNKPDNLHHCNERD